MTMQNDPYTMIDISSIFVNCNNGHNHYTAHKLMLMNMNLNIEKSPPITVYVRVGTTICAIF